MKLWFDCETGGLDPKTHSLLTAYFAVYDENDNFIDDLDLQLKPENESDIVVTPGAMNVNGINLEEHLADSNTVTYAEGNKKLLALLNKHKIPRKRSHYIPSGHNILFDLNFIWEQLTPREDWEKTVHYGKKMDTYIVCTFLQDMGIIPEDVAKLTQLVEYFGIPMGKAHTARGDIEMNIEVYKAIKSLMQVKKAEIANISTNSLLEIIEQWKEHF